MNILNIFKGWWNKMFHSAVKREFDVAGIESESMKNAIKLWLNVYQGSAPWVDETDDIKTIKFAKKICSTIANLTTLDIDVKFDGTRKKYMQSFYDNSVKPHLRKWVEYASACGTVILKPNGVGVDIVTPDRYSIVSKDGNGNITGIVFQDAYTEGDWTYTKLEYHRFFTAKVRINPNEEEKEVTYYLVSNKAFASKLTTEIGKRIELSQTKWANLRDEVSITKDLTKDNKEKDNEKSKWKLDSMLFGVFKMPTANDIDLDSPLGVSVFVNALEELKDLDIAYSRNATEIFDSRRTVLVDERLVQMPAEKDKNGKVIRKTLKLPKYARNVYADDANSFYQEINPSINIEQRKQEIDFQLSMIGCKCGFSNGYFVLDQKTGMITATQVESDDRETIQLIKDIRDALKVALDDLFYAQSVFADLYGLSPIGEYEAHYNFGDITYNPEEDRNRWWNYVNSGKVPAWMYFVKFEGMSEEDAKAMIEEATPKEVGLFNE